jgi:hypothetical protein
MDSNTITQDILLGLCAQQDAGDPIIPLIAMALVAVAAIVILRSG